jgi:hypothetical protein
MPENKCVIDELGFFLCNSIGSGDCSYFEFAGSYYCNNLTEDRIFECNCREAKIAAARSAVEESQERCRESMDVFIAAANKLAWIVMQEKEDGR